MIACKSDRQSRPVKLFSRRNISTGLQARPTAAWISDHLAASRVGRASENENGLWLKSGQTDRGGLEQGSDAYAFLRHTVAEAIDAGKFLPEHKDSHLIAQVLWAGVHGVASLQITHGKDPWITWRSLERRSRTICETTLRGFLTPQASAAFNP
jgi:hypothetical protein